MEYKGPLIGFADIFIAAIIMALFFLPVGGGWLTQVIGRLVVIVFFYFGTRPKKNYFILLEDKLVVKNSWRPFYKLEIPLKEIRFVDKGTIVDQGLCLALATDNDPGMRIPCSNLGYAKTERLIDDLISAIKTT